MAHSQGAGEDWENWNSNIGTQQVSFWLMNRTGHLGLFWKMTIKKRKTSFILKITLVSTSANDMFHTRKARIEKSKLKMLNRTILCAKNTYTDFAFTLRINCHFSRRNESATCIPYTAPYAFHSLYSLNYGPKFIKGGWMKAVRYTQTLTNIQRYVFKLLNKTLPFLTVVVSIHTACLPCLRQSWALAVFLFL